MALEYRDQEVPSTPQPGEVSMTFQGFEPMWNKSRKLARRSSALIVQAHDEGRIQDNTQVGQDTIHTARATLSRDRNMPQEYLEDQYWLRQPHSELDLQFSDHWTGCWSNSKRDKQEYIAATYELHCDVWDKWRVQKPTGEIVAGLCAVYGWILPINKLPQHEPEFKKSAGTWYRVDLDLLPCRPPPA